MPVVLTTCSFNKARLKRRLNLLPPPGKVYFDLIQGRIESARAVDEQRESGMYDEGACPDAP